MLFIRRMFENILINLLSSLPVYALVKLGILYSDKIESFITYSFCGILFLFLNSLVLKKHLFCVLDCRQYLIVNIALYVLQAGSGFACMYYADAEIYTALFCFARVFRPFVTCSSPFVCNIISAVLFWLIYLAEIIYYSRRLRGIVDRMADDMDEYGVTGYNLNTMDFLKNQKK